MVGSQRSRVVGMRHGEQGAGSPKICEQNYEILWKPPTPLWSLYFSYQSGSSPPTNPLMYLITEHPQGYQEKFLVFQKVLEAQGSFAQIRRQGLGTWERGLLPPDSVLHFSTDNLAIPSWGLSRTVPT